MKRRVSVFGINSVQDSKRLLGMVLLAFVGSLFSFAASAKEKSLDYGPAPSEANLAFARHRLSLAADYPVMKVCTFSGRNDPSPSCGWKIEDSHLIVPGCITKKNDVGGSVTICLPNSTYTASMYYRDNRLIYYTPEDLFPAGKIDHSRHYSCSVSGAGETSKTYRIITHWSEIRDTLTYTGSESENIAASAVGLVLGENGCRILTGEEINSIDRSSASNPETVFEVNFDKVDFPASIAFSPVKVWANVAIKTNNNGSAIMNFKGEGKAQGWNNTQWMHQAIERATVEVTRKIVEEITKQVKLTK